METTISTTDPVVMNDSNTHQASPANQRVRPQIARRDVFWNQRTMRSESRKTLRSPNKATKRVKAIILVKRLINERGQLHATVVEIHHAALCEVLSEINENVEGLELTAKNPKTDYKLFFHSYKELKERHRYLLNTDASMPEDQDKIEGIEAALQYIEEDVSNIIAEFEALRIKEQVTFELLWALFSPNTLIVSRDGGTDQEFAARVKSVTYEIDLETRKPIAILTCHIIVRDDKDIGIHSSKFVVPEFPGARPIRDLPIYPLELHPTYTTFREKAVKRGRRYCKITAKTAHCCQHNGKALLAIGYESGMLVELQCDERIVVDATSYFQYQPRSVLRRVVHRVLDETKLSDDELLLCTPVLLGFCLTTKAWGGFAIDRVDEIQWSEEPFRSLVLGGKQKRLISSLVEKHAAQASSFDDVIAGKGQGLIGLLCGNPGCGKTLTAEAVAESTRKPLYTVSAGELGTEPGTTDSQLTRILHLGKRWDAVVLLDEADVFLQRRDTLDVARNALVSIFLRQVEYYPGILIFTTNLVGQIDAAFESRIHFCVKYPDLDLASRTTIWRTFLAKAGVGQPTECDLNQFAQYPLNGRQIKNVISTAKSIAEASQDRQLTQEHVRTVLDVMQDWQVAKSGKVSAYTPNSLTIGMTGLASILSILWLWRRGAALV